MLKRNRHPLLYYKAPKIYHSAFCLLDDELEMSINDNNNYNDYGYDNERV